MKLILACAWLGFIFFRSVAFAEEPITVEMVHYSAGKNLPEDLVKNGRLSHELKPGCKLTFLVRGANLAQLKTDSLKIYVLRTKAGKDVRTINGQPSYKELSFFDKEIYGGSYGKFTLELDASLYEELSTLEIQGSIQLQVADGQEKLESKLIDITQKSSFDFGPFKVKMIGEKQDSGLFSFQLVEPEDEKQKEKIPSAQPPETEDILAMTAESAIFAALAVAQVNEAKPLGPQKNFAFQFKGPLDKIAALQAIRDEKPLLPGGTTTWANEMTEFEFLLDERQAAARAQALFGLFTGPPAAQEPEKKPAPPAPATEQKPVKLELTLWKNLRTVTIPFQHNATMK